MSPSHPHTVGAVANPLSSDADADEEDGYVCPICESECTCRNREAVTTSNAYTPHQSVSSPAPSYVSPPKTRIRIKLTVPANMRLSSSSSQATSKKPSVLSRDGGRSAPTAASSYAQPVQFAGPSNAVDPPLPKRRGRPPKHVVAAREVARVAMTGQGQGSSSVSVSATGRNATKIRTSKASAVGKQPSKGRNTTGITARKVVPKVLKRKATAPPSSDEDEIESDIESTRFPTFMSASAVSSSSGSSSGDDSDSDDSSSQLTDGFDSDSSIKAEEENYIIRESYRNDKTRVKRELLGGDSTARRHGNGDWVIKSRKRSVGPSDGEMEVDSSDDDSDSDTAEEEADAEEEDEPENEGDEDGEEAGLAVGSGYTGVATSWSDSEESNFDADLFFSNLTSDSEGSTHHGLAGAMSDGDETESDVDMNTMSLSAAAAAGFSTMFGGSDLFRLDGGLALEVAGEFSDQAKDAAGLLGSAWEWDLGGGGSGSLSGAVMDGDEEMRDENASHTGSPTIISEANGVDEDDYMGVDLRESDGETTDDDFVGEDGLPTQRAMLLFRWPTPPPAPVKLSAIDPRHTLSPERGQRNVSASGQADSIRPADVLAGRGRTYSSGEDEDEHEGSRVMGRFEAQFGDAQKVPAMAIINGQNPVIPSPYPRRKKRVAHGTAMDSPGMSQTPGQSGRANSLMQPNEGFITDSTLPGEDPAGPAATMDLSDVLDDSFLNSDQCMEDAEVSTSSAASDDDNEESRSRHLRNLSRWERIPMGTFRQTRTVGHGMPSSDVESMSAAGVTDSPFGNTLRWPHAGRQAAGSSRDTTRKATKNVSSKPSSKRDQSVVISPVILPVGDGDRTPTQSYDQQLSSMSYQQSKTRKELKKEKKMKRKLMSKTHSPPHHNHNNQLKYRYHHQHHPNQKSRASNQRSNFFNSPGSSIPPLNI
ncbi:hypothetical protein OE88DRAFT_1734727 [Heliocybe sulcata]|uniref:Uncharacterized protein n=1 Tax=Heliocybe sulcata TaxID=5364 RepID=A0A5C3N2R1_9AGAM|nr:hypothetical protein OE88DRAFT_1734727 [Heliocybe sulcata]